VIPTRSDPRALLLAGLGLTALAVTLALPAIHQWGSYHNFADTRAFRHLPNALNVLSNLPFLIVGALGLAFVSRPSPSFLASWERGPAAVLMFALFLTAFGSAYYHWDPNDRSLFWDRLPLGLLFSALLGITIIERVSLRGGALLFFPLVAAGAGSVIYWLVRDDLRFYFLIQALAVLAIPLMVALFPPRYTGGRELLLAVALYGLAKVFELLDEPIYRLGHLVSGHTLKHVFAGLAGWAYLRMLRRRRPIPSPP
jgi:hypothetical protein